MSLVLKAMYWCIDSSEILRWNWGSEVHRHVCMWDTGPCYKVLRSSILIRSPFSYLLYFVFHCFVVSFFFLICIWWFMGCLSLSSGWFTVKDWNYWNNIGEYCCLKLVGCFTFSYWTYTTFKNINFSENSKQFLFEKCNAFKISEVDYLQTIPPFWKYEPKVIFLI